jgi:hypothetical protein
MLTIPDGVLRRAEIGPEKPKPATRVAEYVVTTPLDTEIWKGISFSVYKLDRETRAYQNSRQGQEPELDIEDGVLDLLQV